MIPDIESVTRILEEVAAEEVLPRFQMLKDDEVRRKAGGELVTVSDVAAEEQFSRRLADLLPGSHVVGEEATADDPSVLDRLASEDDWVWVIDPVDGTGNFARGKPAFAVMAGLVRGGETVAGWIHHPVEGRTATAEVGAGAWFGGERLRVADDAPLGEMRGTLHAGTFAPPDMVRQVQARRARVGAIKSLRPDPARGRRARPHPRRRALYRAQPPRARSFARARRGRLAGPARCPVRARIDARSWPQNLPTTGSST